MYTRIPLPLNDFFSNLETFDLVLMRGILTTSKEAEAITNSTWSHVGMIIVAGDIEFPGVDPDSRLYWEANTPDTAIDLLTGKLKAGPQLVYLKDRLIHNYWVHFDGAFMARKLMYNAKSELLINLKQVIEETKDGKLPYAGRDQTTELTNFLMGRFYNKPSKAGEFSCSQLIAHTFMSLGLLSQYTVSNAYVPADFTEEVDVSLLKGAWLGREIILDTTTIPPKPPGYKSPVTS